MLIRRRIVNKKSQYSICDEYHHRDYTEIFIYIFIFFIFFVDFWGEFNVIPWEEELGTVIEKLSPKIEQIEY